MFTDDPIRDHLNYEDNRPAVPRCKCCREDIQSDRAIAVEDDLYCLDCEDAAWKRIRENFIISLF